MSHVFPRASQALPVVERAEGAEIWDTSGRRYLDAAGGAVVVNIGHGDERVAKVVSDQARLVSYAHPTQFTSESVESYTAALAPLLPLDDARIYPVSGGSEAVETALKMVRAYHIAAGQPERHRIIARTGSYHGNTLGALDASGRARLRRPYMPWLGRVSHVPAPYEYRCPFGTHPVGCGLHHAELLDAAIQRAGPETIAAFIAEPVIGATLGAVVPPDDYWAAVAEVCRSYGVLLVADEVMTGFGRTGRWFGSDHWNLRPDIMTAGKGAASGYWPLGLAACSGRVYEAIATTGFTHGFTFSHSIVGCAVAHEVLRRLQTEDLVAASRAMGRLLLGSLSAALAGRAHVGDVRGRGLMLGVEFVADEDTKAPFERSAAVTERVLGAAKERGLLLYPSIGGADGESGDAVMLGPPFVVSEAQIHEIVELFAATLDAVDYLNR